MSDSFSKEEKAAIAKMTATDKELAEVVHRLVATHTPLKPKTWYGMPAYVDADGKVIVFFQNAEKLKVRYATIGFQPDAKLDDGNLWPTLWAVNKLGDAEQKELVKLLNLAVG